jgi:lipoic acid synthetase
MHKEAFDSKPKVKSKLNVLPANLDHEKEEAAVGLGRFPSWLHRSLPKGSNLSHTGHVLQEKRLYTVCEEARCPNLLECWSKKTATFLAMGKECSRNCGFCDIDFTKKPKPLEEDEPERIAQSVKELGLKHVVITMVARDDLEDGGAQHLAQVVQEIRKLNESTTVELLISDLEGKHTSLTTVLETKPEIFNHNIETVRELTPRVRHKATYDRTLSVLKFAKQYSSYYYVKSGIMLGLGETQEQVKQTLHDLLDAGCDIVTMGQYLQPNRQKLLVKSFVHPDEFNAYEDYGHKIGIKYMYCGPFVRSSYNANLVFKSTQDKEILINSV